MNKPNKSHSEIIIRALKRRERVTAMWGFRQGIVNLSGRISDLRKAGHRIVSKMTDRNGKRFAIYKLS